MLQEARLRSKDTNRLKVKGWKKIFQANSKQKRVAILISDKIDFILLYLLLFFYACTHDIWKTPGQGLHLSCSCKPYDSCGNAGSLNALSRQG